MDQLAFYSLTPNAFFTTLVCRRLIRYLTNISKSLMLIPMLSNTLMSSMIKQDGFPVDEVVINFLISSYNSCNDL